MSNFLYDSYRILNKVYSDKAYLKHAINSEPIDEKNRALTVKICYGVIENDLLYDYYIKVLSPTRPKLVIRTVLKQAMYLIKNTNKPAYTVTNEAVDLIKKLGKGGVAGYVNAVLRKFIKEEIKLSSEPLKNLSLKYSYPEFLLKLLIDEYGISEAEKIIACKNNDLSVRFNGRVKDIDNYFKEYTKKYSFTPTPFKNLFIAKAFKRDENFEKGIYTFQSVGSVAVCDTVEETGYILDACAAPGGKSVLLSEKAKEVTAFELHEHRVELIKSYTTRMGAKNVIAEQKDATVFDKNHFERYDAVLCDVPCSGSGVICENPDIKLNRDEKSIVSLSKIQRDIANNCFKYVKRGGYLYYSTCSILPDENYKNIKLLLKQNKDMRLESFTPKLAHIDTGYGVQYLPHISMGVGFFVAKIKKL